MQTSLQKKKAKAPVKKTFTRYFLRILSRHPSIHPLKRSILLDNRVVYRHGSTTHVDILKEINSVKSVETSSNKSLMKRAFDTDKVKTAEWGEFKDAAAAIAWAKKQDFKVVAKSYFGSRGEGNKLLTTEKEFTDFVKSHSLNNYIFEKFYNFTREYRLHVDRNGCFYTCRKMIKNDTPKDQRWFRNDSNCSWIVEENKDFNKPTNWAEIEKECVKALNAVGLDIGACDVKVQASIDKKGAARKAQDFIVIEINSAPSMGERTLEEYRKRLPQLVKSKYNN